MGTIVSYKWWGEWLVVVGRDRRSKRCRSRCSKFCAPHFCSQCPCWARRRWRSETRCTRSTRDTWDSSWTTPPVSSRKMGQMLAIMKANTGVTGLPHKNRSAQRERGIRCPTGFAHLVRFSPPAPLRGQRRSKCIFQRGGGWWVLRNSSHAARSTGCPQSPCPSAILSDFHRNLHLNWRMASAYVDYTDWWA